MSRGHFVLFYNTEPTSKAVKYWLEWLVLIIKRKLELFLYNRLFNTRRFSGGKSSRKLQWIKKDRRQMFNKQQNASYQCHISEYLVTTPSYSFLSKWPYEAAIIAQVIRSYHFSHGRPGLIYSSQVLLGTDLGSWRHLGSEPGKASSLSQKWEEKMKSKI